MIAAKINVQIIRAASTIPTAGPPGSLKALVELRPGQLLVIGQSSLTAGPNADTPAQMYYIVRASL